MKRTCLLIVACFFTVLGSAIADNLQIVTQRPTGGDQVIWSELGPGGTFFSSPFTVTSDDGVLLTGSLAPPGQGEILQQCPSRDCSFAGNFSPGDYLLWTTLGPGNGPLHLRTNQGMSEVGTQISADFMGNFTAQVQAFDGNELLGTFAENGVTTGDEDNSAIFLGVQDLTGAHITSIVYSLTSCAVDCTDFAINQLSVVTDNSASTPEPATLLLFGSGLLGLAGIGKRLFLK